MTRSTGRPGASGAHSFEHLSVEECWRLVRGANVGRLAVAGADGAPDVFPLNVLAHDGSLYARSAEGSKLSVIADHPEAAIEFDGESDGFHWSVVARGTAVRLETDTDAATDAEIEASGVLRLASANPGGKPYVIRLRPATISGRRVRVDAATGTSVAHPVTGPIVNAERAHPPRPVPHHPPPKA